MKAVLVCVEYADILELTLPYNRHHFDNVLIVTTPKDKDTITVAKQNDAFIHTTDVFYEHGADFNKWAAIEEGLKLFIKNEWVSVMDADILWPKRINGVLEYGRLYTPFRRMCIPLEIPPEHTWSSFRKHPYELEFSGYTQIFHSNDPVLGEHPWYEQNWKHAGGGDTMFQNRWEERNKIRPEWEVLHLGSSDVNWCGRITKPSPQREERKKKLRYYINKRRTHQGFDHEKF